jgi:hypothetical protein
MAEAGEPKQPAGTQTQRVQPRPPRVLSVGRKYDPLPQRETTRSWLALALVGLLASVSLGLLLLTAFGKLKIEDAKDLIDGILSPLIALTGTALGFYFGGHHGSG